MSRTVRWTALATCLCIHLQECNLEEVEEEEPSKSSKDSKKANGSEKTPSLVFKITNRVAYKTVLKGRIPSNRTAYGVIFASWFCFFYIILCL
jgi:hypothetical protein